MLQLSLAPFAVTSAKGTPPTPFMGSGEHRYEAIHDWPRLPVRLKFGKTHGIVVDSQGRVIVAHTVHASSESPDAIAIFDSGGRFVKSWGADLRGGAHGLTLRKEGSEEFLYHCDNVKGFVRKTTLDGEVIWVMHAPVMSGLYPHAKEYKPSNVAIAPNGDLYVADGYGKFYVHHYDAKLNYLRTFGGSRELMDRDKTRETASGTTIWPHAIAIDERSGRPLLMVGERGANSRVQYFTMDGKPAAVFKDGVRWPSTFEFRGDLLLMPDLKAVVTLFDKNNRPIVQLGDGRKPDGATYEGIRDKDRSAFTPGQFVAPHAAAFDSEGNIFVAEWVEVGRVTKLKRVS
ncbi:MAG TPA: hypothetical protein VL285_06495 [Bryobacteraceae bacterium]|nr:hypothetical protein [Bryobacteraceae bacterium]